MAEIVSFTDESGTHFTQKGSRAHKDYLRKNPKAAEEVKVGVPQAKALAEGPELDLKKPSRP